MRPNRKVGAAGLAGALSIIIVWLAGLAEVDIPPEVGSAITTVLAFGAGYFVRDADDRGQTWAQVAVGVLVAALVLLVVTRLL